VGPLRTERVCSNFSPALFAQLVAYAKARNWSLSTALAVLAEHGLNPADKDTPALP
jgi:hypothetical protein